MTEQKQLEGLIKRLEIVYQGAPWYGNNILSSLQKLEADQVKTRVAPGKKNIAEILRHIVAWRQFLLEHLKGNDTYSIELNSEIDWPPVADLSWPELLTELENSQQEIIAKLKTKEDLWLKEIVKVGQHEFNFRFLVEGVIQHDIYHLGQINLLKTLPQL